MLLRKIYSIYESYIEKKYTEINKKRLSTDIKRTKLHLEHVCNLKQGAIIKSKAKLGIFCKTLQEKPKWLAIQPTDILLYLDVVQDHKTDSVVMKVLWDNKVVFIYKNTESQNLIETFNSNFEILGE